MSIISRENPLNLQHQVCVVTSASSPLGVRICKTLLKANAFVLGIDSKTRDATLNAGLGTHFQFEERTIDGKNAAEKIVAAAKEKFGVEKLDVLVNVVEKGRESDLAGSEALADAAIVSMRQQGKGSVIAVSEDVEAEDVPEPLIELTKKLASQHPDLGISFNVILPKDSGGGDTESQKTFQEAKENMSELEQSKEPPSKLHDTGVLALFLASDMSEGIDKRIVRLDGSSSPIKGI